MGRVQAGSTCDPNPNPTRIYPIGKDARWVMPNGYRPHLIK